MSVLKDVTIKTVKSQLHECMSYAENLDWNISEFNETDLSFTVKMKSLNKDEVYLIEFILDDYPELPPIIEFIHPVTGEKGIKSAYPKTKKHGSFFHNKPCICNPCSRLAYANYKGVHNEWNLTGWRQNPQVGNLTNICAILSAIYFRINDKEGYNGRME